MNRIGGLVRMRAALGPAEEAKLAITQSSIKPQPTAASGV